MAQTKLPTNPPTTLREYLQQTEDAISKGNLDDALARCQNVLAQYVESLEAQRLLGEVYLAQGKLDEAQQSFDWVLTNDPENVLVYCDRALVSENLSDFDTALDCYQQAYELSRGNSQIREEFNKLSSRAGQQGFMFSRAGLARLYMRGDLFTQSIQEWEAVLAITPDRLDARIGLLETLWRDGLYERAEQLARQVLLDVPSCLKALLLLAYITSSRDLRQSQDLLKRAEAMDPDLQLAQELFADLLSSQSNANEPFLSLLKRAPVTLTLPGQEESALGQMARQSSSPSHPSWPGLDVPQQSSSSPSHPSWPGIQTSQEPQGNSSPSWPGLDAPQQSSSSPSHPSWPGLDVPQQPTSSSRPSWPGLQFDAEAPHQSTQESAPSQPGSTPSQELKAGASSTWEWPGSDLPASAESSKPGQPDLNAMLTEARKHLSPDVKAGEHDPNVTPWIHSELSQEDRQKLSALNEQPGTSSPAISENPFAFMPPPSSPGNPTSGLWSAPPADGSGPSAPPPWLGMLSQDDRQQMSGMGVAPQDVSDAPALADPQVSAEMEKLEQPSAEPVVPEEQTKPTDAPVPPPSTLAPDNDEDDDSFGPAWLKSIGAASMELSREMPAIPARPQPTPVEPPKPKEPEIEAPVSQEPVIQPGPAPSDLFTQPTPAPSDLFAQPEPSQPDVPFSDPSDPWAFPGNLSSQPGDSNGMPEWANQLLTPSGGAQDQAAPSWLDQLSHNASAQPMPEPPAPEPTLPDQEQPSEHSVVASLEDLEKSLYSQGFVPLEPNSLSSLVQGQGGGEEPGQEFPVSQQEPHFPQESVPPSPFSEPDFLQELQDWRSQKESQESSLSSALAALTGMNSQPQSEEPVVPPQVPVSPVQPEQPEWASMLGAAPASGPLAQPEQPSWLAPQYLLRSSRSSRRG
ncbi:tetratricopeptide repeat protein [Ktedonospora formicarum]|uniref:Tetratricopeptide repeat protein n=1 Tax=Ktedonospora formicarum TaxID=2778364 RepID=A0A8J3MS21_9CHLR|nr:tetratricopeptide repeat protein [Ktedonospora formicarum]GHO45610.1 hypothetical protein KSX_37730 [Ktedonospora formicarum]